MPHTHTAAVVDRLLRQLASGAPRRELSPNINGDLVHVWRTLAWLQDVLVSLEIRPEAQEWMGDIKQVAYDVEDLLDELEDRSSIESRTSRCIAERALFCHSCSFLLHNARGNKIMAIRRRLDFSVQDSVMFSLMQYPCPDVMQFDNGVFDGPAIIGRDNDKAKIKDMLLQSNAEHLSVLPIVGLVGLGKTTLARLIFLDQGGEWNFDLRIWLCLNRKLDLKKVASAIIAQCNQTEKKQLDVHTDIEIPENLQFLKNCLQDVLSEKSCLIILDDLSSTDKSQLDELKEMLKGTDKCTKVLVTTSSEITAELVCTIPPYKLRPLSEEDSWTVFSQHAFGNWDSNSAHLKEIGRQIVKRCEGIPLLSHYLGSSVQNHITNVWLAARDEELWKLERRLETKTSVFSPLYRIYYGFPSTLKLCFLYLSVFPKGSVIDKEKLIQQWIALEMIGSKHDSLSSYAHGEMCIQDLLSIHFLQVLNTHSVDGMDDRLVPTALYMHNFIHEFARHVACDDIIILDGNEMQNGNTKRQTFQYALLTCYKGQSSLSHSLLTRTRALHLRSFEAITFLSEAFELLKHLRVLNLSGCCIRELPTSVGHLKRLKYLDVSGIQLQTLPSAMISLTNLEILDLSKTSLKELPSFIGSFLDLKYLNMQGCEKLRNLPPSLGHLRRLDHLRLSYCNSIVELPDSMCDLHDLRILDLSRCTDLQHLPPLFGNLMNLEDLNLCSCFSLRQLPEAFGKLCFLRSLNMSGCSELQHLPESLTNLRKLEVLMLQRCFRLQDLPLSFASIRYLRILDLAGCEALHLSTDILTTNLEYLNLQRCLKLQTRPYCFDNFSKLKYLNLSQCHPTIDCLKSVGYLSSLEYLSLSQNLLDIPMSFTRLQKLHTLDLTGCPPIQQFSNVHQILAVTDIIGKMAALRFVLTKDPLLVSSLPQHILCSVGIVNDWRITNDELVIADITRGSRGLTIAEGLNLQNRLELRFLKLEWLLTSHSDENELIGDVEEDEVLEMLEPNQNLEHFDLVRYAGHAFPTWMTINMITSLPCLVRLCLFHLENCNDLPPLGKLRNLRYLHIKDMPNLRHLEMGLSGGLQPFKKLTQLKLEKLINLKELSIFSTDQQLMFPTLEELVVLSCTKLTFKPSLPRCKRYELRDSNNILSCGQPLGLPSSPSPTNVEISRCMVPSSWLQWLKSLQTLKNVVIDACVGDDGAEIACFELQEIKDTHELSNTNISQEATHENSSGTIISHEMTTQDGASKDTSSGSSTIQKLFPKFNTTLAHSVESASSYEVSMSSEKVPPTPHQIPPSPSRFAPSPQIARVGSVNLSIQQILSATQNFSPSFKLGEGGFGMVYRAVLPDGNVVAVKRAKKDQFAGPRDEFSNEVDLLAKIDHPNLVRLLGFIDKGNERIIITEYVPNGTLREHLDGQHGRVLDFNQRLDIAIGVAHALTYLHLYSEKTIIHCDVKSSNILLTDSYRAKVSDFGFARSGPSDTEKRHISTNVKGTAGYLDPEYYRTYQLTPKSDVFSFGILLVEILSARRPIELKRTPKERVTIRWTFKKFNEGNMREILDPLLEDNVDDDVLEKLLSLVFQCAAPTRDERPTMNGVRKQLWEIRKEYGKTIRKV